MRLPRHLSGSSARILSDGYVFVRTIENYLQMMHSRDYARQGKQMLAKKALEEFALGKKVHKVAVGLYVAMGWLVVVAAKARTRPWRRNPPARIPWETPRKVLSGRLSDGRTPWKERAPRYSRARPRSR